MGGRCRGEDEGVHDGRDLALRDDDLFPDRLLECVVPQTVGGEQRRPQQEESAAAVREGVCVMEQAGHSDGVYQMGEV